MRALKIALIALGLLLATARVASAEKTWWHGVIHCHSTFSDGSKDIKTIAQMAADHRASFLVVTDHFEDIILNEAEFRAASGHFKAALREVNSINKPYSISEYQEACWQATVSSKILVVPGIEVGIGTNRDRVYDPAGGLKTDNLVHMLGVGYSTQRLADDLVDYLGLRNGQHYSRSEKDVRLDDAQSQVARILHRWSMATIIAHPYIEDPIHFDHYTLYKNRMENIDGIEFFNTEPYKINDDNEVRSLEALGLVNRDEAMGEFQPLAVTSGCDYHGIIGNSDPDLFYRMTSLEIEIPRFDTRQNYVQACIEIARFLHRRDSNIASHCNISTDREALAAQRLPNSTNLYKDGASINSLDIPTSTSPIYIHIPGVFVGRYPGGKQPHDSGDFGTATIDSMPNGVHESLPVSINHSLHINNPDDTLVIYLVDQSTSMNSRDRAGIEEMASDISKNGLPSKQAMVIHFSGRKNILGTKAIDNKDIIASLLTETPLPTDNGTAILDAIVTALLVADDKAPGKKVVIIALTDGQEWDDGIIKNPRAVIDELAQRDAQCIMAITDNGNKVNDPIRELLSGTNVSHFNW